VVRRQRFIRRRWRALRGDAMRSRGLVIVPDRADIAAAGTAIRAHRVGIVAAAARRRMTMSGRALVLFSGGQDSTVCLAWALARFDHVETVGFDYGQRHAVELACRRAIRARLPKAFPPARAGRLGEDHLLALPTLGAISDTAMTRETEIAVAAGGLPTTFVPGRNVLFFTYAAAIAWRRGIRHLVGGMGQTDYSGYPDCRDDTVKALQIALNLGMDRQFVLHTPLMWIDKAASWALAEQLGGRALVELIRDESHSCYRGLRDTVHGWGHGCGDCPACRLRAAGWEKYASGAAGAAREAAHG
jgi:7-cyano-7-deazaguanine synthase